MIYIFIYFLSIVLNSIRLVPTDFVALMLEISPPWDQVMEYLIFVLQKLCPKHRFGCESFCNCFENLTWKIAWAPTSIRKVYRPSGFVSHFDAESQTMNTRSYLIQFIVLEPWKDSFTLIILQADSSHIYEDIADCHICCCLLFLYISLLAACGSTPVIKYASFVLVYCAWQRWIWGSIKHFKLKCNVSSYRAKKAKLTSCFPWKDRNDCERRWMILHDLT